MKTTHYLAIDLGAESGRVMLGTLSDGRVALEELHRFPSRQIPLGASLRWDLLGMFGEILHGLRIAGGRRLPIRSVSVDSWGVDYAWSGAGQPMLAPPYCYRDVRNDGACTAALEQVPAETIFAETGLQFMPFNTVYQLFADHRDSPGLVGAADRFLMIADQVLFLLCGAAGAEQTLASTSQIYDPRTRSWSDKLIGGFGFRREVFPPIVPSGTKLGVLLPSLQKETGLGPLAVVASCSHDTGAAVAAVPAQPGADWAYLSSGTWSLIGVELDQPLVRDDVRAANFTNEGGFAGSVRFLKNISGLWLLQECRREWVQEGGCDDYIEMERLAGEARPLRSIIDPADARFVKPGGMREKIAAFCRETGQPAPESVGEFSRCIFESLALSYRANLARIQELTGRNISRLHIVGGGSKNLLLDQLAANATGKTVLAGPGEATALGNVLVQAWADGQLESIDQIRATVRDSFPIREYHPQDEEQWAAAAARLPGR